MSKKDVDKYYTQICADYHELIKTLKDAEQEVSNGLLNPDNLVLLKEQIQHVKVNWERISYIMYLFNRPVKKKKQQKYNMQNKKLVQNNSTEVDIHKEHSKQLEEIKKYLRTS